MISISGVDAETGKICEIHCKNYEQLLFKLERGDEKRKGKKRSEDRYMIFLIPEGRWYMVPEEEFQTHMDESEYEDGAVDLEIDLEDDEDISVKEINGD
jgi:hypothetical protein